ncbi:hypothetical protein IscW_ISCW015077 [Ixodes scapularis]|uniref:Uncharacterized protein n=1 Tax=Ixodes scapularis TaxID=6945 RepID=B7QM56_IXOSC|nr:hypothetical protein IscW_ISCW015077 [Ixodes scapularis]|eukprot:XP_002416261.1 hypothetical protein IscW_ISCW015077 [Ixodes scapularis]
MCSAWKHDGLLAVEAARTGGGANPVGPLNEVETRILAIFGRGSSRGCSGLHPRQSLPLSSEASKRWRSHLDKLVHLLRNMKKTRTSRAGTDDIEDPMAWPHFEQMYFVRDRLEHRR